MPQSKQTTLEEDENESSSNSPGETPDEILGDVVEWQCPYCEQTRQNPREIRDHITTSTEDDHMGTNGWSVPDDLIGYDANGNIARVIEGFTPTVDPEAEKQERGWKKKQAINAWLARPPKADVDAIKHAIDNLEQNNDTVSRQYVYNLLRDLHNDNFDDQEIADLRDPELEDELGEKIDQFHEQQKTVTMSAEPQAEEEAQSEEQISVPRGEGRKYLYNALMMAPEMDYKALPKVLDMSTEYARRVFKQVREGDVPKSEVEDEYDEHVQRELIDSLDMIGELEDVDASISDTFEAVEGEEEAEAEEEEEWPTLEERSKTIVINSYLLAQELGEELAPDTVSNPAECGYEYARRTLKELREGDIAQHEINDKEAEDLKNTLHEIYAERGYLPAAEGEEIEQPEAPEQAQAELKYVVDEGHDVVTEFDVTEDGTADTCIRLTDEGERCSITAQDESHFCHMHRPDMEEEEDVEEVEAEELPEVPGSKRDALLNLHQFDVDLTNEQAGNVVDSSAEYARQTFNKISDNEITQSDVEAAQDEEIQSVLKERLQALGHIETEEEVAVEEEEETTVTWEEEPEEVEEEVEAEEEVAVEEEVEQPSTEASETLAEVIEELTRIQEKADVLLRQAQFEGDGQNKKAEFIAKEMSEEIEELLQKTQ